MNYLSSRSNLQYHGRINEVLDEASRFLLRRLRTLPNRDNVDIYILSHGYGGLYGQSLDHISTINADRLSIALKLSYLFSQAGYRTNLILSGGNHSLLSKSLGISEADFLLNLLLSASENDKNIKDIYNNLDNILIENNSRNTVENIRESMSIINRSQNNYVVFFGVTDRLHGPRVLRELSNSVYRNNQTNILLPGVVVSKLSYKSYNVLSRTHHIIRLPVILENKEYALVWDAVEKYIHSIQNISRIHGVSEQYAIDVFVKMLDMALKDAYNKTLKILSGKYGKRKV